jgi:hypothetical protein
MPLKRILNRVANNPFRFGRVLGANGDQANATLADVNTVVDQMNNLNAYRNVHFALKSTNNGIVMKSLISGSGIVGCSGCDCTVVGGCDADCQDGDTCGKKDAAYSVITGAVQLALGVYELTLNTKMPFMANPKSYGMFVSQLEDITHQVQISKIYNTNKIKIETFISGVPSGLVLNNTPFMFNVYPMLKTDLYCGLC